MKKYKLYLKEQIEVLIESDYTEEEMIEFLTTKTIVKISEFIIDFNNVIIIKML